MTNLLTTKELNKLTCSQIQLNILRSLATSDLSFLYMLYTPAALLDIVDISEKMLQVEQEEGIDELSAEEKVEYLSYINDLKEYATNSKE